MNERKVSGAAAAHPPARTVWATARITEAEKLKLLALSRKAGAPGNLSVALRWAIEQATQRQPAGVER